MKLADILHDAPTTEVWIIGDLFDRASPSVYDIATAHEFIQKVGKPVKYIEGNHERVSKVQYTLRLLEDTLGITKLPEYTTLEGVSITSIGHDSLDKLSIIQGGDILLSHFRWSHPLFGKGELSKAEETRISQIFSSIILGDIHSRYSPLDNVKYIGSPYSISFSSSEEFGVGELHLDNGKFIFERVDLHLPNKISAVTTLPLLQSVLVGIQDEDSKYRITVMLRNSAEAEEVAVYRTPSNVELIGKFIVQDAKEDVEEKIEIRGEVKDILIDSLTLPSKSIQYIRDVLR
jgi:DNA repair exonuclease SbcCD nuclease subunit